MPYPAVVIEFLAKEYIKDIQREAEQEQLIREIRGARKPQGRLPSLTLALKSMLTLFV